MSRKVFQQWIRNRIIDSLESFAIRTWVNQLGTDEIINMWYDNTDENETFDYLSEPVYSKNEQNAIKKFHYLLESSYKKIPTTWQLEELQNNNDWAELEKTEKEGLNVFMVRGRFSEEQEIT